MLLMLCPQHIRIHAFDISESLFLLESMLLYILFFCLCLGLSWFWLLIFLMLSMIEVIFSRKCGRTYWIRTISIVIDVVNIWIWFWFTLNVETKCFFIFILFRLWVIWRLWRGSILNFLEPLTNLTWWNCFYSASSCLYFSVEGILNYLIELLSLLLWHLKHQILCEMAHKSEIL